MTLHTQQFQQM